MVAHAGVVLDAQALSRALTSGSPPTPRSLDHGRARQQCPPAQPCGVGGRRLGQAVRRHRRRGPSACSTRSRSGRARGCSTSAPAAAARSRSRRRGAAPRSSARTSPTRWFDAARRRAAEAGVEVQWVVGDAVALPFEDASFDIVTSTFGHMFAPDQAAAASELARVCRPGGTIGLCCWTPQGNFGRMMASLVTLLPIPEGFRPPMLWGSEPHVRELLEPHGVTLEMRRDGGAPAGPVRRAARVRVRGELRPDRDGARRARRGGLGARSREPVRALRRGQPQRRRHDGRWTPSTSRRSGARPHSGPGTCPGPSTTSVAGRRSR